MKNIENCTKWSCLNFDSPVKQTIKLQLIICTTLKVSHLYNTLLNIFIIVGTIIAFTKKK